MSGSRWLPAVPSLSPIGQFVQVWATFAPDDLLRAYDVPVIEGGIEHV